MNKKKAPKRKLDPAFEKAIEKMTKTPPVSNEELKKRNKK